MRNETQGRVFVTEVIIAGEDAGRDVRTGAVSRRVILYFAVLSLLTGLASGIAGIPISFYLKDVLKLSPQQMANYGALAAIPGYVGFVFGYTRDRWKPLGPRWGDRGYLLLLPPLSAVCLLVLASGELTYSRLLIAALVNGIIKGLAGAAIGGMMASVAQRYGMTGRLSATFLLINMIPGIFASLVGGWMTAHLRPQTVLMIAAGLSLNVAAFSFWRPAAVFGENMGAAVVPDKRPRAEESTVAAECPLPLLEALRRLVRYRPFWFAMAVNLLWSFAPGWGTPLFFHLTNTIHLTETQFGAYEAVTQMFIMVTTALYGILCRSVSLKRLLWLGTVVGIVTNVLFLLIRVPWQAFAVGAILGALLGLASGAFFDLELRSYPKAQEGLAWTLSGALSTIAGVSSNVFGAWLYERGGFALALGISTVVTVLILGVLPFIPRAILSAKEGEHVTQEETGTIPTPVAASV
jgi:Na+/melibiose symporter-like transporter